MKRIDFNSQTHWVIEDYGVLIVGATKEQNVKLTYPQAALWALLPHHQQEDKLCDLMAGILRVNRQEAQTVVTDCIREWSGLGLIKVSE